MQTLQERSFLALKKTGAVEGLKFTAHLLAEYIKVGQENL
jgi:hypothetical protein